VRRHLYLQIYAAFLGVAVLCAAVAAVSAHLAVNDLQPSRYKVAVAELLAESLPREAGPKLQTALRRLGDRLKVDIVIFDPRGAVLATTNTGLLRRTRATQSQDWTQAPGDDAMRLRLPDGRILAAVLRGHDQGSHKRRFLALLFAILIAAAIGCYPIARRITRRLERLQRSVDRFGSGDLRSRVSVHGRDEVAQLAGSFNRAFARIEELMEAQRRVLASASHEFRSPMARLRMAIELLSDGQPTDQEARSKLLADSIHDIEELNALVEDVLLSARLEGRAPSRPLVKLDLTALLRVAAERVSVAVTGEAISVMADERLLLRLLRNLFENAVRHGAGTPIDASVQRDGERVLLRVSDRGPGVAEADRERIFEPFYRPEGHREGVDGGVGLGLALVRQLATHHHGTVRCYPREGGGTCFEVSLPIARDASVSS